MLSNGELALVGEKRRAGGTDAEFWLIKTTTDGREVFKSSLCGRKQDSFNAVSSFKDGQVLAVGETSSFGTGTIDSMILRVTRDNRTPPKMVADSADDILRAIKVLPDDSVIIAGGTSSKGAGGLDGWVVKYDSEMKNVLWERVVGGKGIEIFNDIEVLSDGSLVAVGQAEEDVNSDPTLWLVRLGADGKFND